MKRTIVALHRENSAFRFQPTISGPTVSWRPYDGLPEITAVRNGHYHHDPVWYRNFLYVEEHRRGLDHVEDLASPGAFSWDFARDELSRRLTRLSVANTGPMVSAR